MKFHLNPSTGNPGRCSAKEGSCPFGANAPHYTSIPEARAAYEAERGGSFPSGSTGVKSAASTTPLHLRAFDEEARRRHTRTARELLDLLSLDGEFELPEEEPEYDEEEDRIEVRVGDFRLLASGASVNAYLHEPSGEVYKVPHFESVGELWSEDTSKLLLGLAKAEKEKYEGLDHEDLAEKNLAYLPTRYFGLKTSKGPVPIIVQAYLDPSEYEPHYLTGTEQNRMGTKDLWDFNMGNVRLHLASGQLVLIDCIRP